MIPTPSDPPSIAFRALPVSDTDVHTVRGRPVSLARHALWLGLIAGCSLNAEPKSGSSSQRALVDAGVWKPRQLPDAGESGARAGAGGGHEDAPTSTLTAGKTAASQGGKSPRAGEGGASPSPPSNGGTTAAASGGNKAAPADQAGAGGASPAPASGGAPGASNAGAPSGGGKANPPAADGGSGGAQPAGGGLPRGVRQAFVDAVIGVLMGSGQGEDSTWDNWRRAAGGSGDLSPEFVTPMLNALVLSGTCLERAATCVQVCLVVAQNCAPCAADKQCRMTLGRVCGERAATCK